jgi:hypothetical protein
MPQPSEWQEELTGEGGDKTVIKDTKESQETVATEV